jgi:cytochrome b561
MREAEAPRFEGKAVAMHWLTTAAVIGILILMVWKPGA